MPLAALLFDPPHSLVQQSWAPRDMRGGGTINADGFGVGWYPPAGRPGPLPPGALRCGPTPRCRRWRPPPRSGAVLAAVRSATVGMPVTETAAAPFAEGRWLFSHNGVVARLARLGGRARRRAAGHATC